VARTALIVIDMINAYDFPDAEKLVPSAEQAVPVIKEMIENADGPVIYVNDNFGHWKSNRDDLVEEALNGNRPDLVEPIKPDDESLFVVKARHSIFYQTPLEYLLNQEDVGRVILTGQVTEQCILYSALDAYIRHFDVRVPPDAVAHIYENLAEAALTMGLRRLMAVAEAYPQLRANENFLALQEELIGTESKIAFARQFYNDQVLRHNTLVQQFPSLLVARMTRHTTRDFFEIEETSRGPVGVDLS
jgi:nicotinamidase-related amidase